MTEQLNSFVNQFAVKNEDAHHSSDSSSDILSKLSDPKEVLDALLALVEIKNATVKDTGGSYPSSSQNSIIGHYEQSVYLESEEFSDADEDEDDDNSIHATFEISYNMETGELTDVVFSSGEFTLDVDYGDVNTYIGKQYKALREHPTRSGIDVFILSSITAGGEDLGDSGLMLKGQLKIHPRNLAKAKKEIGYIKGTQVYSYDEAKRTFAWNVPKDCFATTGENKHVIKL